MKKILYFFAGIIFALSGTALAANMIFTDQDQYAGSWFENATISMQQKGIIKGYADGSFGPNNSVSRAELVVMFDRYNDYLMESMNNKGNSGNDTISISKLNQVIDNTLKLAKQNYQWYSSFVVMAESDLKKLSGRPKNYESQTWREQANAQLPEGYTLYTDVMAESGNPSYLHFFGEVCIDDVCGNDKDQWYGPFYSN